MEFRRGGQRDERRRRVLMDEMLAPNDSQNDSEPREDEVRADAASGRTYSDAALVQYQPRVSCVIPKRIWGMFAVLLAGAMAIAGVQLLYAKVLPLVADDAGTVLTLLDPNSTGSLASWFASSVFFLGTLGCLLVYSIRRHRLDDYRGRYTVWLWAAAVFLVASFDAATHAHQALTPLLVASTGMTLSADGAIWAWIALAVLFGAVMIRMTLEVWNCPAATSFIALAAISYVASAVFTYHTALRDAVATSEIVASSTLLSAHFSLLYAVLVFARRVYLDAQGERRSLRPATSDTAAPPAAAPKRAPAKRVAAKSRPAKSKSVRVDEAHEPKEAPTKKQPATTSATRNSTKQPAAKQSPAKQNSAKQNSAKQNSAKQATRADAAQEEERPMSKAERRRLRKLERRQKRNAADSDV